MNKQALVDILSGTKLTQEEYRSQKCFNEVAALLSSDIINTKELKAKIITHGLPANLRSTTWKLLLGYLPPDKGQWDATVRAKREDYQKRAQLYDESLRNNTIAHKKILKDISVDVPRTFIEGYQELCADSRVRNTVGRALYIWASNNKIAYYQGMMDLIYAVLIVNITDGKDIECIKNLDTFIEDNGGEDNFMHILETVEADTFFCFDGLMNFLGVLLNKYLHSYLIIIICCCYLECIW